MTEDEPETLRIGVICYPTYGGSGAVAVDLAAALADRGHEVHVISYASPFRLTSTGHLLFHEVNVPEYPLFKYPPYAMALASKLAEVAMQHELQVLHAHYAIPHSLAAFLAREITGNDRLGIVTTLHGTDITLVGSDPSYQPATLLGLRRSDAVTAVSRWLAEQTLQSLCHSCEIEIIGNFVDVERYRPHRNEGIRKRFAEPGEPLLMHMSNFRPVKRVNDAIRIFHRVYRDHPARLVMIGDGPERSAAEGLARELELHHRVTFTGSLPDAETFLPEADAFLLPSDGESFGLASLEAMACGVPVVAARAGGLPEVVRDGEDGILEAVGDVAAAGRRLSELLADREAHEAMRRSARQRAVDTFRSDQIVKQYEAIYRRVIAGINR